MANSGRVIISLSSPLRDGTMICSSKGHEIARVMEVIGPIKRPFASAMPLTNNMSPHLGKRVFALEQNTQQKMRHGGRRR